MILIQKTATFVQILCRKPIWYGKFQVLMLKRYIKTYSILLLALLTQFGSVSCSPTDEYVVISGFAQGGTYAVKFNLNGRDGMIDTPLEEIRDSIDCILKKIDSSLSGYNRNSILSRLNAGEVVTPDRIFLDMYGKSYEIYQRTDGVVDVASGPLFDLWGFGFSNGSLPSVEKVNETLEVSGMDMLGPDLYQYIPLPVKLNFNAVAQGYSCDLVAKYLYSIGVKDMLVDIGEFFCDGKNPSGKPWSIGIDRPVDGNNVPGADLQGIFRAPDGPHGIVTSGNYRKFYVSDGKKYAHTIDPRTGYPVTHSLLSATVVAEDAMTADAYATWCMVVGLEQAKVFLETTAGFEGCLIYDEDGQMKTWCSSGFILEQR